MKVLWASVWKEWLVLLRDRGGLALLFLMPAAMVVIMAIVQDAPFRDHLEQRMQILVLDQDQGEFSKALIAGIDSTATFEVLTQLDGLPVEPESLQDAINSGRFQIGIQIAAGLSKELNGHIALRSQDILVGLMAEDSSSKAQAELLHAGVTLLLDPTTKNTFRTSIELAMEQIIAQLEARMLLEELVNGLAEMTGTEMKPLPELQRITAVHKKIAGSEKTEEVASNSTQHNVPAWTIFAIFFIVVPLSGSMVRERMYGTYKRLRTMSASIMHHYTGKLLAFSLIGLLQTALIIALGLWLLPLLGLAKLNLGSGFFPLCIAALTIGVAAASFGLLVGTLFNTHQQASIFGVVAVVIMAAMGGIWVPLYVMPEGMQQLGHLSPMNWALECFNMVFLRGYGVMELLQGSLKIWGFSLACVLLTFWIGGKKR